MTGEVPTVGDTLMWEVRAEQGRRAELLRWVEETGVPVAEASTGFLDAEIYLGGHDRIVVIVHWEHEAGRLPEPPPELLARPVAQWPFRKHRSRR